MNNGTGAVIYVRVSTDEQADGPLNLSNQQKKCAEFCAQKGLSVAAIFLDPGESARSADRPEFQANARLLQGVVRTVYEIFSAASSAQRQT